MTTTDAAALLAFIGLNVVVALSGAFFRPGEWYEALRKPAWRPPNWLFGPAWAVLYLMIAIAGWLVWRKTGLSLPIVVYLVHLLLNAGWSGVFFGLRRMDLAFVNIVALWLSIAVMITLFRPIDGTAALLLVPYLAWVTFAGALNFTVWRLNRA